MKARTIIGLVALVAVCTTGCSDIDASVKTACSDNPLLMYSVSSKLDKADVSAPYTPIYGSMTSDANSFEFDVLDRTNHVVHVDYDGRSVFVNSVIRGDERYDLDSAVASMAGDNADYTVDYMRNGDVRVTVQGMQFIWKNKTLQLASSEE